MIQVNKLKKGCGKQLMTSRTERDDAVLCGDYWNDEKIYCPECKVKLQAIEQVKGIIRTQEVYYLLVKEMTKEDGKIMDDRFLSASRIQEALVKHFGEKFK